MCTYLSVLGTVPPKYSYTLVYSFTLITRFTHIVKTSWQIHHYLLYNFYYMFKYKGGLLPIGGVIHPRVWKNNKNLAIYGQFTTFHKNMMFITTQTWHSFVSCSCSDKSTRNCRNQWLIVRDVLKLWWLRDGNGTRYATATQRNLRRFTSW